MAKFQEKNGVIFNCGSLRLREKPSLESEILTLIPKNVKFKIIGQYREWFKVEFNSIEGYCLKVYVDVVK